MSLICQKRRKAEGMSFNLKPCKHKHNSVFFLLQNHANEQKTSRYDQNISRNL
jgi:hypothetical protein